MLCVLFANLEDDRKKFLEHIYERYSKYIYKYHYARLRNMQAAECAMMDTFVRIVQNADTLMECSEKEIERNINVYSIQVFLNVNKKQGRRRQMEAYSFDDVDGAEKEVEANCDLLEKLLQDELLEKLIEKIKNLDECSQQIMLYKVQFDMPNKEIAERMDMNQSTVNTIIHRTYKILRNEMEGYING